MKTESKTLMPPPPTGSTKMPYFSFIVPLYGGGGAARRCLDSILSQGFEDFELIIVDDLGDDEGRSIARNLKDERVSLITNPQNLGAFHSRWEGMKRARGRFVLFVDDDDFVAEGMLQRLYEESVEEDPDILVFNLMGCSWDPILREIPEGEEAIGKFYGASICARAYSQRIIRRSLEALELYFPPIPRLNLHEDALICFVFLYFCRDFKILTDVLYFYCHNPNSTTRMQDRKGESRVLRERMRNRREILRLFSCFDAFLAWEGVGKKGLTQEIFEDFRERSVAGLRASLNADKNERALLWIKRSRGGRFPASLRDYLFVYRQTGSRRILLYALVYCLTLGRLRKG